MTEIVNETEPEPRRSIILIDVREEHEFFKLHVVSTDKQNEVLNIPSRLIQPNVETIRNMGETHTIYLLCRSSGRSEKIKSKYFNGDVNIISIKGGLQNGKEFLEQNGFEIVQGKGGYGFNQKMQLAFSFMLWVVLLLLFIGINKKYIIVVVILMISSIYYQLYSESCFLAKLFPPV